jgi:hypothetical protein
LTRQLEVPAVVGTSEVVVFDDEQHVPAEIVAHELNDARRDVGIGVDARRLGKRRVGGELG